MEVDDGVRLPPLINPKLKLALIAIGVAAVVGYFVYNHISRTQAQYEKGLAADRIKIQNKINALKRNTRLAQVVIEPVTNAPEGDYWVNGTVGRESDLQALDDILMEDNLYHVLDVIWRVDVEVTDE